MEDDGGSLPSNYVTILQLKERWLQQQSDSLKPKHDSASKIPNQGRSNRHALKSDVTVHDSASKIANEDGGKNDVNQLKPGSKVGRNEVTIHDCASTTTAQVAGNHPVNSKPSRKKKNSNRDRNPRDQNQTGSSTTPQEEPESLQEKKQKQNRNHPMVHTDPQNPNPSFVIPQVVKEKKKPYPYRYVPIHPLLENNTTDPSNSTTKITSTDQNPTRQIAESLKEKKPHRSRKKNTSKYRNPRSVNHQLPPTVEPQPEPVQEKKQHRYIDRRLNKNRNQEVGKTTPLAEDVEDLTHSNDSGVVEAVTAAVKEITVTNVSQGTNRRWASSRRDSYRGSRNGPPFGVKKGQMTTAVWVKKGESATS